jgi:hypothetical protein
MFAERNPKLDDRVPKVTNYATCPDWLKRLQKNFFRKLN